MITVPFYSQIVDWNNEDSGFPNKVEIEKWEGNCCGIACLRMVFDFNHKIVDNSPSYWELVNIGLKKNAYCEKGWIHRGLLEIAKSYGLDGQCHRQAGIKDIIDAINRKSICIVSVTKHFLGGEKYHSEQKLLKGGHLVVAYEIENQGTPEEKIICNHPSTYPAWNKQNWAVETNKWSNSFSGNFIEIFENYNKPTSY